MIPKGILVNADGTTEQVAGAELAGKYFHRKATCGSCGHEKALRRYEIHWAHSAADGDGVLVGIEVPT